MSSSPNFHIELTSTGRLQMRFVNPARAAFPPVFYHTDPAVALMPVYKPFIAIIVGASVYVIPQCNTRTVKTWQSRAELGQ